MHPLLENDLAGFDTILAETMRRANAYLASLAHRPAVAAQPPDPIPRSLPERGVGALAALDAFEREFGSLLSGSPGPRYLGFVTGGATPAGVAGDWLASAYDQNAQRNGDTCAPFVELETIERLKSLLGLPAEMTGSFVSGATQANLVGIALGRQYLGRSCGVDVAAQGMGALPNVRVLSAVPHSSTLKAMSVCGVGRSAWQAVPTLAGREAMDVDALARMLEVSPDEPTIVVVNAGTVNTVDFDDIRAIGALRARWDFWLHVDAAFGAFAACVPERAHVMNGIENADSVTVDAHKWLNVPYDSAMQFTRHLELQVEVFQNASNYLPPPEPVPHNFLHLTPENSRRFRALPVWLSLLAYGREGFHDIVERNCRNAERLGALLEADQRFELAAPVRLNVTCFAPRGVEGHACMDEVRALLARLKTDGTVFCTPSFLHGRAIVRAAFCNWRTTYEDVDAVFAALKRCLL
jgi:glutamate/tyrosine decarboxylase-like PLP-dependent enzyme